MATKKNSKSKEPERTTAPVKSIHVVRLVCTNCSEEEEKVYTCPHCKAPMKVVEINEKFGDEAEKYLSGLGGSSGVVVTNDVSDDDDKIVDVVDAIVDEDDELEGDKNEASEDDDSVLELTEIFPDDGAESKEEYVGDFKSDSLDDIVDELDKVEEEKDLEDMDLGNFDDL